MTTINVLEAHPAATTPLDASGARAVRLRVQRHRRLLDLGTNVGVLVGLWLAYAAARGVTAGEWSTALDNADRLLRVQDALPLPPETWIQGHALSAPWLLKAANRFYLYVHFPGTVLFLAWTWARRRELFGRVRDALVLVTGCALVLHVAFPLAPPRMMPGFVDTGAVYGPSPYDLEAASAANQIAAMPSLHVGWALLVAIAAVAGLQSRWRWLLAAHPVLTTAVVVVTANHYWADGVVAAALVVGAWSLVGRSGQRWRRPGSTVVDDGEVAAWPASPPLPVARHPRPVGAAAAARQAGGRGSGRCGRRPPPARRRLGPALVTRRRPALAGPAGSDPGPAGGNRRRPGVSGAPANG